MRADDARIACPLFQAEYGGEVPTSALQLKVAKIGYEKFKELNLLWHSRLPECTNCFEGICYGLEYKNIFYGVAWWSKPVARTLSDRKMYELRRMALASDAPKYTASRFLSVMVRIIRRTLPEIKVLISYQDTDVHTGTIYKASGWMIGKFSGDDKIRWHTRKNRTVQSYARKIRWELEL